MEAADKGKSTNASYGTSADRLLAENGATVNMHIVCPIHIFYCSVHSIYLSQGPAISLPSQLQLVYQSKDYVEYPGSALLVLEDKLTLSPRRTLFLRLVSIRRHRAEANRRDSGGPC